MTDTTPRAGAPLLAANQAQKNVTHNEALYQFDALLCARFLDRDLTAPPSSPNDGDTYLVKATGTSGWTGQDGNIAYCADGAWRFYAPFAGLVAYVADETALLVYNGTAWVNYGSLIALENVATLGVNTAADSTNKLAVQSNAALFTDLPTGSGGSGDIRVAISKQAASNTASLLFQDDFSGHAEIGLTGDDDFHIKVSPDGSGWYEALKIANASGLMTVIGDPATVLGIATKQYVDGSQPEHTVRLAVKTSIDVSNPGTGTFDGVTAANGDMILLSAQSTGSQNGPWVFNGSSSALTRPAWFATAYVNCMDSFRVMEGGSLAGTTWRLTTVNPITGGTTPLTVVQSGAPIGTSGAAIPLLNGANTWSAAQTLQALLTGTAAAFSGNLTIDNANAQTPGAVIIGNASTSNGAAVKFLGAAGQHNWMIGHQINVSDVLEITPSTATGGSTFATPVVQIGTLGLGIGMTPSNPINISSDGATYDFFRCVNTHSGAKSWGFGPGSGGFSFGFSDSTDGVAAGGFDASGNFLVGRTSAIGGTAHNFQSGGAGTNVVAINSNHAGNPAGLLLQYGAAVPNDAGHPFIYCQDTSALRMEVLSNGGVANYAANNVNLSDARAKPSIELIGNDSELTSALWAAHKQIDWNRHKYADQTHDDWNYGYTAQGIQTAFARVAPELVDTFDDKTKLLGVYHHDITNIGGAVLSMTQTRIETAEQKIARLEARLADLESIAPRA